MPYFDCLDHLHGGYITYLDISGLLDVDIATFHYCGSCLPGWTVEKWAVLDFACSECLHYLLATTDSKEYYVYILASDCHIDDNDADLVVDVNTAGA